MDLSCLTSFLLLVFHALVSLEASGMVWAQTARFTEETDKQALLEFKSQVFGPSGDVVLASWNHSVPLCSWARVVCGSKHRRVTGLDLGGLKLSGVVSPFIGNLSFLRSLNLGDNALRGSIPVEVARLFRLHYLNMSNNFLGGEIPAALSNCSSLLALDLSANHLEHDVPSELGSLSKLVILSLGRNNLTGEFPASLGNLTSLQKLDFIYNQMDGEIPETVARLTQMVYFRIALNRFSGVFPPPIYNLSSLLFLSMTSNNFSGNLRPDFGTLLPNLQVLYMGINYFVGTIPSTLSNISTLRQLDIPSNQLTGSIPLSFGKLRNLQQLGLNNNSLGSYSTGDLDFIGALANCSQLQSLNVGYNRLGGPLPASIANLSNQLTELSLGVNFISGSVPYDIGNLINLQTLDLGQNLLTGKLPDSLGTLSGLGKVLLYSNGFSGEIPSSLGNITQLSYLYLLNNSFEGNIPSSLGNCSYLLDLELGTNKLSGAIPQELMTLPSLVILNVSYNSLVGVLPKDIGNVKHLIALDVSHNKLSGKIPQTLGSCLSLVFLWLQGNFFDGVIPDISGLSGIKFLDLSNNNLSGPIPGYLVNFSSLQILNLSVNNFEGAVPTKGVFQNSTAVSVFDNPKLCGGIPPLQLKPCSVQAPTKSKRNLSVRKKIAIGVSLGISALLLLSLTVISLFWYKRRVKNDQEADDENGQSTIPFKSSYEKISYGELHNATGGFSSANLIGSGNFGYVYKAFLGPENKAVAIKVLNLCRRGAAKSFMAECEALRGIRHRNLVRLVTACSSTDFKGDEFRALVYEFMPNGSLDTWLHPEKATDNPPRTLTLHERLDIAIDVASVLVYLHSYSHTPIAHCDLKPSNILIDGEMTAHVSDFGLARLLLKFDREAFHNHFSSAGVRGTIGYAAPEYGMGGQPSIMGDVYSFGILLLEMFTGKRPTEELFVDDLSLHSFAKSALPERVVEIAERSILRDTGVDTAECLRNVIEVGVKCSEDSPVKRIRMGEVVKELVTVRDCFFGGKKVNTTPL